MLREAGYTVYVVEHFNAFAKVRRDLFGFIDIVAMHPDIPGILGVQTTTGSHLAERKKKAEALLAYHLWIKTGNVVEFHGWRKILTGKKRREWRPVIDRVPPLADQAILEQLLS